MNINVKFDFKNILQLLLKKFSIVLWVFLGLILIAEAFIVNDSLSKVLTASDQSQFAGTQLIRVNFATYDAIENRLNENAKFLPINQNANDPFGVKTND
jgi:tellurite resistance protein TehA-like permease